MKLPIYDWRGAGVHISLTDDERDRLKQQARRLRKLDAGAMTKTRTDLTPRLKKKRLDNS